MPSSYSSRLRFELPVTGELSGTWGDRVNIGVTALIDTAIAGYASVAMTDADYTLTTANGAADEARNMGVRMTGALTQARNVIVPSVTKKYIVTNATSGGFAITVKTAAGTGISVPNGKSMVLVCDGTNVIDAITNLSSLAIPLTGLLKGNGAGSAITAAVAGTDYAPATSGSSVLSGNGAGGFSNVTIAASLSFAAGTLGIAVPVTAANGGTGQAGGYTVGDILYASGASALSKLADVSAGNVLISGGLATPPAWGKVELSGPTIHVNGTLGVTRGGTGSALAISGIIKGDGAVTYSAATAGTDYAKPNTASTWTAKQAFNGDSSHLGAALDAIVYRGSDNQAYSGPFYIGTNGRIAVFTSGLLAGSNTLSIGWASGVGIADIISTGDVLDLEYWISNGGSAAYFNALSIDGVGVTVKWLGGTPTGGTVNKYDKYEFKAFKNAGGWTVFGKQTLNWG